MKTLPNARPSACSEYVASGSTIFESTTFCSAARSAVVPDSARPVASDTSSAACINWCAMA
jgi:hypothetical protein